MDKQNIATGVVHEVPADIQMALTSNSGTLTKWNNLTPIQRNEWICWITIVKKPETRAEHIERMLTELKEGEPSPAVGPAVRIADRRRRSGLEKYKYDNSNNISFTRRELQTGNGVL